MSYQKQQEVTEDLVPQENNFPVILFEGLDGSGKTYALNHLKNYYESKNLPVHVVDSIPFRVFMNSHDKEWFDLTTPNVKYVEYMAWQVNNFYKNIKPYMGDKIILIDRFLPSCYAYNDLTDDEYSGLFYSIMSQLLTYFFKPDVTFIVDVDYDTLYKRHLITNQPEQMSSVDFWRKVKKRYNDFFQHYHNTGQWKNVVVLDGTKQIDLLTKEMVEIVNEHGVKASN